MYQGVSVAEQLEFDSWPDEQKELARRVLGYNEILHAVRSDLAELPPTPRDLPPDDQEC